MVNQKLNDKLIARKAILNLAWVWGCFLLRSNQLFGEQLETIDFTGFR